MPPFARKHSSEDVALVDPTQHLTWAEVDETINRAASGLIDHCTTANRRVAVFAENAAETAIAYAAIITAGCSAVAVNFHLNAPEAAYILKDSGAELLFVDAATLDRGVEAAAAAGVETIVGWGVGDPRVLEWGAWLGSMPAEDPNLERPPLPTLMYTSGTTGQPKATELPPTMFVGGADVAEHLDRLAEARYAQWSPHMVVGPMYHTGPLTGVRTLLAGVTLVILGKFDAERLLAAIDEHRPETAIMVPTHFVRLLALPDAVKERYDVSSLVRVGSNGSRFPVDVHAAMIDWWGPIFTDSYGASEVGAVCRISSNEWLKHRGSVGRAVPGFSAEIRDENLDLLPPDTEGLLYFRDHTGRGIVYPNDPDKTAAANPEPGLFTLGEVGYVDEDDYVFITDRASDMVVSGGVNLYPAEAEQFLINHPAIADVACIGLPDDTMGERLCGLIVAKPGVNVDTDEISTWLRERLTSFKCPRAWHVVEHLRRNAVGKINKRELRDAFLAGQLQ